jgi:hypothetical protein
VRNLRDIVIRRTPTSGFRGWPRGLIRGQPSNQERPGSADVQDLGWSVLVRIGFDR